MNTTWNQNVINNFNNAAINYNKETSLQKAIAFRLARLCKHASVKRGFWVDLGSGTGHLAQALEKLHPGQKVLRVDGCSSMLQLQSKNSTSICWDLNLGLPYWSESPNLIASNFALHWLNSPELHIEKWLMSLEKGGWLAISLPISGSFPEWTKAAKDAGVRCTALPLPNIDYLLHRLPPKTIHLNRIVCLTISGNSAVQLLKQMVAIGASSTSISPLSTGEWRRLFQHWPGEKPQLTWKILMLMITDDY